MNKKIYSWECQLCGKLIESLHKTQFEYNQEQHINSHKRKETKQ